MSERSSFAFTPAQPTETHNTLSPGFRGGEVVGGDSAGGVVRASPMTMPTGDTGIPEFLARMVEPYVKAKQQEGLLKGYDAAASGKAYKEIAKSDSGWSGVFGPSYFHQGAAMYAANTAVDKVSNDLVQDPDLYKLSDDERSAEITRRYKAAFTGDPTADSIIGQRMLETRNAVVNTLAKKNFAYGQEQAVNAAAGAVAASSDANQSIMSAQSGLSSPTDKDQAGMNQARSNLLASFIKPHGMTDDSYKRMVNSSLGNMLASGNLHSFNVMKAAGFLRSGGVLDDDQIAALENRYDRAATKAMHDTAAFDPVFISKLAAIYADTSSGRTKHPMEAATRLEGLNQDIMGKTGSDVPLFDMDKQVSAVNLVTDAIISAARRQEERQWHLEDRQAEWSHQEQVKADDLAAKAAQVGVMFGQGDAAFGSAIGLGERKDYDIPAMQAWVKGDMGALAKQFVGTARGQGFVSEPVARTAQAQIAAGVSKYSPDFEAGYRKWKALSTANAGAAATHYGRFDLPLRKYDGLVQEGISPLIAHERVFGDMAQYDLGRIAPAARKDFQSVLDSAVDGMSSSALNPWSWRRWDLPTSTRNVVKSALANEAIPYMEHTGMSPQAVVNSQLPRLTGSGRLEVVGRFGWINDPGTPKLPALLAASATTTADVVMSLADTKLKHAGFPGGAYGDDYTVHRFPTAKDRVGLYVLAVAPDGLSREVIITQDELKAEINAQARADVQQAQPKPAPDMHIPIDSKSVAARREGYRHAMNPR